MDANSLTVDEAEATTSERSLCFVIMSFSKDNHKLHDAYELGIKPVVESFGLRCERVDEQEYNGRITERIYANIREAFVLIANMTDARPNCYYELGYAHALEKPVIHVVSTTSDIHFDVKDMNFIVYEDRITSLKAALGRRLRATVESLKQTEARRSSETGNDSKLEELDNQRAKAIRPRVLIDFAEYYVSGERRARIVFRNRGRGTAFLRDATLIERSINAGTQVVKDNVLKHSLSDIVVESLKAVCTNVRHAGVGDLWSHIDGITCFVVQTSVFDIDGNHVEDYERKWDSAQSDVYVEKEHGEQEGEWLNRDKSGYGFIR